mmetsp:Transcript_139805/g.268064  ORF Transcript_139805/g.268064 Transcript_139805/m.268064 type:complete len:255 (-) Transcript_139805:128-892(-)
MEQGPSSSTDLAVGDPGHAVVGVHSNELVETPESAGSGQGAIVENADVSAEQADSIGDVSITVDLDHAAMGQSASTISSPRSSCSCLSRLFKSSHGTGDNDPAAATHQCMEHACCVCFAEFSTDGSTARAELACSHPVCKECAKRICSHAQIQGAADAPCPLCRRSMSEFGAVLKKERYARAVERRRRRIRLTQFQWWQLSMMMLTTSLTIIILLRAGWNIAAACVGAFLALQVYIPAKQALQHFHICGSSARS